MGREVKRVATDFQWPLEKVWKGYINPFYKENMEACPDCELGYAPIALKYYKQWYGNAPFDPVEYGSKLLTPETPALRAFVEYQVDRKDSGDFYTQNGRLSREEAILRECNRLISMWNGQWNHHLIEADVEALVKAGRLADFILRFRPGMDKEEYIRTRSYYLWEEAGRPEGDGKEFWEKASEEYSHHWLPFWNGHMPSPEEVNDWNIRSFGHDSINCGVCVRARCEREGHPLMCETCNGDGHVWFPEEAEKWAEDWKPEEPPAGEGYQIWETVSEGSPISPVFSDPRILAEWMANSPPWGADQGLSADQWLKFITGPGWAPSAVICSEGFKTGVEAVV